MKKSMKISAVLSASAFMALFAQYAPGASGTVLSNIFPSYESFAAAGWQQSGDDWYYYDNNGNPVTNELKKSGDVWYYLGSDGKAVENYLLRNNEENDDNIYYFDENGAMVRNQWVNYTDDDGEARWYYFDGNGRAARKTSDNDKIYTKSINGKTYSFDEDGRMLYGWAEEDGTLIGEDETDPFMEATYYFGDRDDGAMRKNTWYNYEEGSDAESNVDGVDYSDMDTLWFWFDSSGKKADADDDDDIYEKTINGNKYSFDANGVMLSEWVETKKASAGSATSSPSNAEYKFYSDNLNGTLKKNTWIYAVPTEEMDAEDHNDDEYRWFYADTSGKIYTNGIKKVGGKKYVFDKAGIMHSDFVVMNNGKYKDSFDADDIEGENFKDGTVSDLIDGGDLYYFGADEEDGAMKTGKSVKIELSDDTYTFGFDKSGIAYGSDGVPENVSNKYYLNGLMLTADKEMKYGVISDADGNLIVISASGTRSKGNEKSLKDGNDGYILINEDQYYGYTDSDHKPVWEDGVAYEYDEDAKDHIGDEISKDEDGSSLPDDMVIYIP